MYMSIHIYMSILHSLFSLLSLPKRSVCFAIHDDINDALALVMCMRAKRDVFMHGANLSCIYLVYHK
ncbi:hypothetical protein AAMO2058_000884600 [Amorphochlora amoebiformis]